MFLDFLQCLSARRNPSSDDCVCIDHMWSLLQDYSDIIDEIKHHVSSLHLLYGNWLDCTHIIS